MEQDQCLMMETKRKYSVVASTNFTSPTTNPSSYGGHDSWEEQAFAEDAANSLGGSCIWPPRSYSCTFCRREFRSAQALGGHMNVHRRDRARLKQQPSSPNRSEILCHETHQLHKPVQIQNPFASFGGYLYPSPPVCGIAYKRTNPNSDLDFVLSPSSSSPSKALLAPSSNGEEKTLTPLYESSIPHKISSPVNNSSESLVNLAKDQRLYSCKFHPEAKIEKPSKGIMDSRFRGNNKGDNDNDYDDVDGVMSLNLVMHRTHQSVQFESSSEKVDHSCKKRKTDAPSILFFPNSSSVDRQQQHHMKPKMFEFSPSSIEELDLELRLGNRSKV